MARVDEFLKNLELSNLLNTRQWAVVRREIVTAKQFPRDDAGTRAAGASGQEFSPSDLAARLVDRGFITRWQADMLLAGKKAFFLGKYRLLDCIGTGGMGAVFKALQADLGRIVAIKILSADVTKNRQAVARFRQEIQAVAILDDPHIVAAYDAGNERGCNYLVMEYVEGHDLGYLVKQRSPLEIGWACECIRQAALGLAHAHEQGLVHRDIKPTNLIVTTDRDGRPLTKILDLGLARFVSEMVSPESNEPMLGNDDGSLTQIGQFLGTPDYVAPEQAHDTRAADIRSDIFSLGCTLFRTLTGELPFSGESVLEKIVARKTTEARHVCTLRSDVPQELDAVVARMLARNPSERYQTPRDVALALAPFCRTGRVARPAADGAPAPRPHVVSAGENSRLEQIFRSLATEAADRPVSVSEITSRLKRPSRRGVLAVGGAAIAVLAAVLLWQRASVATLVIDWPLADREGGFLSVGGRPTRLPDEQKFTIRGQAGAWQLELRRDGFEPIVETRTIGRGERSDFSPHWRPTLATARRIDLADLERRATEVSQADVLSPKAAQMRLEISAFVREHAGSPEAATANKLLAGLLWPLDLVDGSDVPADEREQFTRFAGERPGAKLVGFIGDSRLKFWNEVTALATSRDGRRLAGAALDGTVQVFDATDGRRLATIVPPIMPTELVFSPVGNTLAIASNAPPVVLWNTTADALSAVLEATAAPIAFSSDGKLIAGRAARQEIALWDAQTGELRRTMQGHATGDLRGMSFSHNGKMLASFGSDNSVLLWDVASGQERRRFPNAQFPQFSPDDAYLAAGTLTSDLVLWDTRTGETQRTFDEGGYPLAFLKGGKSVVSRRPGRAILWDLETGDEIRTIIDVPELTVVSPDGAWFAGGDATVGELRLWNLESSTGARAINTAGPVAALAFAADEFGEATTVMTGSQGGVVQVWSSESGNEHLATPPSWGPADISPDSRWLAARHADRLEIVDIVAGNPARTVATGVTDLDALSFSPDGRTLAGFGGWGFFRTSLRLWDPQAARELALADHVSGTVRTIGFSGDSQLLAVGSDSRSATVWNLSRRTVQYDLDDFTDRIMALAFHPDGRQLAVACLDQTIALWDLKAGAGQAFAPTGAVCRQLVFSRDGKYLAGPASERIVVWNVASRQIAAELATGAGIPTTIAWHPADKSLAAGGNEGCVWLWNDPSARRFRVEPDQTIQLGPRHGAVPRVFWSPEGRHVVTVNGNGTISMFRLTE
jgi:serine/threonine protein kinase/WD40 repeat protein